MDNEERAIQDLEAKAERKAIESGDETQKVMIKYNKAMRRYMESMVGIIEDKIDNLSDAFNERVPDNLPQMASEFQKKQIIDEHHKQSIQKWKSIAGILITGAALASLGWGVFEFMVTNAN
jgi:hypothetical protein